MADARMNPMVKILMIGIAFFAQVLLVAGISIYVYKSLAKDGADTATPKVGEDRVEATQTLDEFNVSTMNPGICKFKVELYLNDVDVVKQLDEQKSFIRDNIARIVMNYTVDEVKEEYRKEGLHQKVHTWLNENLLARMGKKKSFFSEKEYKILRVNIFDFQVFAMGE